MEEILFRGLTVLTMAGVGLLLHHLAGKMERDELAPNEMVGMRTRLTRSDERAWYFVHRRIAKSYRLATVLAGLTALSVFLPSLGLSVGAIVVMVILMVLVLVRSGRRAEAEYRALLESEHSEGDPG